MEGSLVAYKVFTNGSTLQASELNENLMQQSTAVFSNAAARTAAITSPVEGQLTYLEDVNTYDHWNGSAWVSPFGLTLLTTATFTSGTTIQVNNVFSSNYAGYLVHFSNIKTSANVNVSLRLSSGGSPAATNNYQNGLIYWSSGTLNTVFQLTESAIGLGSSGTTNNVALSNVMTILNPAVALPTQYHCAGHGQSTATMLNGVHQVSTAYDGFQIFGGTFTSGTIRVYGYRSN
jgi:hypothetical protein